MNADINKNVISIFSSSSLLYETFKSLSYNFLNIKKEIQDSILKFNETSLTIHWLIQYILKNVLMLEFNFNFLSIL